jgi:hypothetical protein
MTKNIISTKKGITRRNFIGNSALAMAGLSFMPSWLNELNNDFGLSLSSPLDNTKIRIKIINDGIIHEGAWEGSCRTGDLEDLTREVETEKLQVRMEKLKETIATKKMPKELEILEPVTMSIIVERGNPEIMLPEGQLEKLAKDNNKTDLYVAGDPFVAYKVAARYRKPVCIMHPSGARMDGPAGIRTLGLEGYYAANWEELFELIRLMFVRKAFKNTKLLNVTNFPDRYPYGVHGTPNLDNVKARYGMDYHFMDYDEFFGYMDEVEKDTKMIDIADRMAGILLKNALSSNMTRENIAKSIIFYLTAATMMQKQGCNAFTIECFELCSSLNTWNRKFTPCLTHALLKDSGIPSSCEGDINALLAMMIEMYLSNKAIYMGNPYVDIVNNKLRIGHSVASLKMAGYNQEPTPYHIHSFMHAGYGATLRHCFADNAGEMATVGRFDPTATKMLVTLGKITGGRGTDSGFGCSNGVDMEIPNGRAFRKASENYGHHLAFVYGNYIRQIEDLSELMKFEVENIT